MINLCFVCVCVQSINAKVKTEFNKYMVKQKRELKSRFVTQQEKKKGSSRLRLLKSKSGQEVKATPLESNLAEKSSL